MAQIVPRSSMPATLRVEVFTCAADVGGTAIADFVNVQAVYGVRFEAFNANVDLHGIAVLPEFHDAAGGIAFGGCKHRDGGRVAMQS